MLKSESSNCCKAVKASAHFLPWLHMRFGSAADLASDLNHVRRFAAGGFQKGTSTKNMHVRCQGPHEVDFSHWSLF